MSDTPQTEHPDFDGLRRRCPEAIERWFEAHSDAVYTFVFYRVGRAKERPGRAHARAARGAEAQRELAEARALESQG
ncbi:MAG: hypothetical protein GY856_50500 [bacterium]|nr:hypothetical protein [bacterium]